MRGSVVMCRAGFARNPCEPEGVSPRCYTQVRLDRLDPIHLAWMVNEIDGLEAAEAIYQTPSSLPGW